MRTLLTALFATAAVVAGLGAGAARAGGSPPTAAQLGFHSTAIPAAMCGYSCRSGGRYIQGPPSVCYEQGLNYCGPSRGGGGPGWGDRPRSDPGFPGGGRRAWRLIESDGSCATYEHRDTGRRRTLCDD
jgi:hypothetical protein